MMKHLVEAILSVALVLPQAGMAADSYDTPPPAGLSSGDRIYIWSTHYNKHFASSSHALGAIQLKDKLGQSLGEAVSPKDFCYGAMEGTLVVKNGTTSTVYNADGLLNAAATDCSAFYPKSNVKERLGRQAFVRLSANAPDGLGVLTYRLVPDRTVAVNHTSIPYGTVLYIPLLRKDGVRTASGVVKHDGYMMAADTGGSMGGCHVDYFTGDRTIDPDPKLTSSKNHPVAVEAYVIHDKAIVERLTAIHNLGSHAPHVQPIAAGACKASVIPPYPKGES